ncbi:MAG: hypothetical protein J6Q27_00625 [Clostridia bacterium]|nr:hypothetical protein [Clostridia bacterium]
MRICELQQLLQLETAALGETEQEFTDCYIGDMLSVVMSRAKEGDVWLTVQTNVNIVAVAALVGIACVIVVEGMEPDADTVQKAIAQGVTIFKSPETAFSLASKIQKTL